MSYIFCHLSTHKKSPSDASSHIAPPWVEGGGVKCGTAPGCHCHMRPVVLQEKSQYSPTWYVLVHFLLQQGKPVQITMVTVWHCTYRQFYLFFSFFRFMVTAGEKSPLILSGVYGSAMLSLILVFLLFLLVLENPVVLWVEVFRRVVLWGWWVRYSVGHLMTFCHLVIWGIHKHHCCQ